MTNDVVGTECKHTENQTNRRCNGQTAAFGRASSGIEGAVIDDFERCLVKVAVFVRVRVEEETLRATFHCRKVVAGLERLKLERFFEDAPGLFEDRADL